MFLILSHTPFSRWDFVTLLMLGFCYPCLVSFSSFSFKTSIDTKVWTKSETQVAHSHLCSNLIFVDFSIWNYKIIEIAKTKKNCTFPKQKHRWHAVWRLLPTCEAIWSFLIGIRNYKVIEKDKKNDNCTFPKEKRRLQSSTRGQQYLIWSKRDYIQPKDWIIILWPSSDHDHIVTILWSYGDLDIIIMIWWPTWLQKELSFFVQVKGGLEIWRRVYCNLWKPAKARRNVATKEKYKKKQFTHTHTHTHTHTRDGCNRQ